MATSGSESHPLRIYLDQWVFSDIAKAIARGDQTSVEVVVYHHLTSLVAAGRAQVYFSTIHIAETMGFGNLGSSVVAAHCDVVDTLTEGHCIRDPRHLHRAELELALADLFTFPTTYSRGEYAYGRGMDSIDADVFTHDATSLREEFGPRLEEVERRGLNRHDVMRQIVSDQYVANFSQQFPSGRFSWTRDSLVKLFTGTDEECAAIWRGFSDGVTFKTLVTHYGRVRPGIASWGQLFDEGGASWVERLGGMQRLEPLRAVLEGRAPTWDREAADAQGEAYLASCRGEIEMSASKHGFDPEIAVQRLREGGFRRLPYTHAVRLWMQSYLSQHKGAERPRRPKLNDISDFYHCANAAYVDIFVTEAFAAEILRPLAPAFGVRIVRSLGELRRELPGESS